MPAEQRPYHHGNLVPALIETGVPVGADAGQQRHLLAAHPRHAAGAAAGQACLLGRDRGALRGEEVLQGLVLGHAPFIPPRGTGGGWGRRRAGPAEGGTGGPTIERPWRRTVPRVSDGTVPRPRSKGLRR